MSRLLSIVALCACALAACGATNQVNDTKFTPGRGFYFAPVTVLIQSTTPGATIVYTTDFTEPSLTNGIAVPAPDSATPPTAQVTVTNTTLLRAAAFKTGLLPTDVDTHSYIFPAYVQNQKIPPGASTLWIDDPPGNGSSNAADWNVSLSVVTNTQPGYSFTNALLSIPSLSLTTPTDGLFGYTNGIYARPMKEGDAWERRTSAEMIYPDGRSGFHVTAGLSLHGATSRQNSLIEKHSMHLAFRSIYGASKLDYKLFPDSPVSSFDDLILRACSTDAWAINNAIPALWSNTNATYQRDQWMRDAQRDMGQPTAHGLYVNLYLNGLYWGLYNLTEHLGGDFGASYIGGQKEEYDVIIWDFTTNHIVSQGNDITWKKMTNMATAAGTSAAKYWEIQGKGTNGLRNTNMPVYVDMDNLIDYMLLHIYSVATDWPNRNWWAIRQHDTATNRLDSTGFKFLVWDQEVAVDRTNRMYTWANSTAYELVNQVDTPAQLYDSLRKNFEFRLRFADHLQKHLLNGGVLTVASNRARWMARATEIDYAIVGESARWGDARRTNAFTRETDWLPTQAFTENVFWPTNELQAWQRFRNVSLFSTVPAPVFNQYGGYVPAGFLLTMTRPGTNGSILYTLDGTDPRGPGGGLGRSAVVYSSSISILSPLTVNARVKDGTNWSPIIEAVFSPPQDLTGLALTEIMYNPPPSTAVPTDGEFLELKNRGTQTLDLSSMTIPAISFTFPLKTYLAPNQFYLLVKSSDETRFRTRHPGVVINALYSGSLDNGGETIECLDPFGISVFKMTYDDEPPWPAAADGFGFSLVPVEGTVTAAPDHAAQWRASAFAGGSPGADDPVPTNGIVVINEILAASVPPQVDRVELYNPNSQPVDIGGWYLTDDRSVPMKYKIPRPTVVAPYGFVSFDETQFNSVTNGTNAFALDSNGDELYLFSAGTNGKLSGFSYSVAFKGSDPGVTFGRYINSVGDELWPAQLYPTASQTNAGPRVGPVVINEINYHPGPYSDPFVELLNITQSPVALYDTAHPTNTWKLAGLDYIFPQQVVIPPNGVLLLVATTPSTFIAKYDVPAGVIVLGPYGGGLQNDGETLALEHPTADGKAWVVVDQVRYNDKAPWPPEADGLGYSLARINPFAFGDDPANWQAIQPNAGRDNGLLLPSPPNLPTLEFAAVSASPYDITNGLQVRLTFVAGSNTTYYIQWSDRIESGVWQPLQDVGPAMTNRTVTVIDSVSPDTASRFYRLALP